MDSLDNDKLFNELGKTFGKYAFEGLIDTNNKRAANVAAILALALLAYAGVETVTLIFRKNFGRKGINLGRLLLSVLSFVVISVVALMYYFEYSQDIMYLGSKSSLLATSIFYMLLAGYILVKGIKAINNYSKNAIHEQYRGDSALLSFLVDQSWSPSLVQNLAEPLFLFSLGFFLLPINLLWGIPLMFCAVSSWLHLLMEAIIGVAGVRNMLSNKGYVHSKNKTFSEVIN